MTKVLIASSSRRIASSNVKSTRTYLRSWSIVTTNQRSIGSLMPYNSICDIDHIICSGCWRSSHVWHWRIFEHLSLTLVIITDSFRLLSSIVSTTNWEVNRWVSNKFSLCSQTCSLWPVSLDWFSSINRSSSKLSLSNLIQNIIIFKLFKRWNTFKS